MQEKPPHPGVFIREEIFPRDMTVTTAANLLDIGRPALSRVLNGKASLSPRLAKRIQHAFGFSAEELLKMQASYNAKISKTKSTSSPIGSYVPPFLQIHSRQIEEWSSENRARRRLAVLLRILVNSTGTGLRRVDFPGNDDAERHGWDGIIVADKATPWIPEGLSVWEFGCDKKIKSKANRDFNKKTGSTPESERMETTFVFVTPRRWPGKNDWEKEHDAEDQWKNVRVFDASDLEQWMEQSIPAQILFAHEIGIPSKGVFSLEKCWQYWQADCEPALAPSLFDQALKESKNLVERWLDDPPGEPLKIAADSTAEALAYLHVVFSEEEPLFRDNRDSVAVFTEPGVLSEILSAGSDLIVVSTSPEIEKELAPHRQHFKTVLVYSQNMANVNLDIVLKPLNYFALTAALEEMELNRDEVAKYRRECGYSLTVLRRLLSRLPHVKTPDWADPDKEYVKSLVPIMFAGAWNSNKEADRFLVSELWADIDIEDVEKEIARLSQLEDSPVWAIDAYRGVKSKLDALFAICESVTETHIRKFLEVAEIVLSERNPALDLSPDKQWLAELRGKSREISDLLRQSIINSFVMLAVHGDKLFGHRINFNIETHIQDTVKKLLRPTTARTFEDHSDALPAYAEAAPDVFLSIIERDLDENKSRAVLDLFDPAGKSSLNSSSKAEMLWALESLAWSGEYLAHVVEILARIAEEETAGNWSNSAANSLAAIFRSWLPQTSVSVDKRIEVFNGLLKKHRGDIVWSICLEQLRGGHRTGHYSYKPKCRTDGHGYGELAMESENQKFIHNAAREAIDWKPHTKETLADLIQCLDPHTQIPYEMWSEVWGQAENWLNEGKPSDEEKCWLYEKIRDTVDSDVFPKEVSLKAKSVYKMLEPSDPVLEHRWLFRSSSVPRIKKSGYIKSRGFREYAKEIQEKRVSALREIYRERGITGLIELAGHGEGQTVIGALASGIDSFGCSEAKALVLNALDFSTEETSQQMKRLIAGTLLGLESAHRQAMLEDFSETIPEETFFKVLLLSPFGKGTWELLKQLQKETELNYWKKVAWQLPVHPTEVNKAVEMLIGAGRPLDAAQMAECFLEEVEPKLILRLLESIVRIEGKEEKVRELPLDREFVEDALQRLDEEAGIPAARILSLEFEFVNFLQGSDRGMRILEREIGEHPELFAEMIALAYKRDDKQEDRNVSSVSEDILRNKAWKMHRSIESIRQLPRGDEFRNLDAENLIKWVCAVREMCELRGRLNIGDFCIGSLFSNSPEDDNGIWPCKAVRDTLEEVYSEQLGKGFKMGRCDLFRTHIGERGDQEREIEDRHKKWAQRIQYSHPKTSEILREIAKYFSHLGRHYDIEAEKFYRQLSF